MATTRKTKEAPRIKAAYRGVSSRELEYGTKLRPPVRRTMTVKRSLNGTTNIESVHAIAVKFAETHSVPLNKVHIDSTYSGYYLRTTALEPLKEFQAEVRRVENFNKALDEYRADRDAVDKLHREEQARRRAENEAREKKLNDEAEIRARVALTREVQEKLRNDAKFMAALTDEVLSDEQFIRRLKALFSKGV